MLWFRWHCGSCEDAKFRVTARNANVTVRDALALWACLLESASRNDPRGVIPNDRMPFIETILDLAADETDRIIEAMEGAGLVETTEFAVKITNWGKRQFETDKSDATNAERQRRWRAKHQRNGARNGSETAEKPTDYREQTTDIQNTEKKESTASQQAAPPTRGSRFAIEKLPDEWRAFCKQERPELDPDRIFVEFRDYWASVPGQRGRKLDWFATWRNRVRDVKAPGKSLFDPPKPATTEETSKWGRA